ncbi:MAG: aromatic ring-opening dioxygenase catalytic subunit (LigB family) [Myxococcota bacterium]|jgi:aromatic ring-opening dioxygenase catalytic subunit (LigB family)
MRLPTIYIPHGGGPWPWLTDFGGPKAMDALRDYLVGLPAALPQPPVAILCVTAHWEESVPTVSTAAQPGMLYDYSGFPPHTYQIRWSAPGSPSLAARVRTLLGEAGISSAEDPARGYDHGTFVPLAVSWPSADVPTVQLSLVRGLDPAEHLRIGQALRPLRDEGVLILGSGMSYHSMRGYGTEQGARDAAVFDDWLSASVQDPARRGAALQRWSEAPSGRASHPREEHLLPLMVVTGAAGDDRVSLPFKETILGTRVSAVQYG